MPLDGVRRLSPVLSRPGHRRFGPDDGPSRRVRGQVTVGVLAFAMCVGLAGCGNASSGGDAAPSPTTSRAPGSGSGSVPPPTTVWAKYPNPCGLLTDQEIAAVTKFAPGTARRDSRGPNNELLPNCMSQDRTGGVQNGYFTITLIPPGSSMLTERSDYTDVQDVPGVGTSALVGHIKLTPGHSYNGALVDMGDGGFLIGAQVKTELSADQMRGLVQAAASRWG